MQNLNIETDVTDKKWEELCNENKNWALELNEPTLLEDKQKRNFCGSVFFIMTNLKACFEDLCNLKIGNKEELYSGMEKFHKILKASMKKVKNIDLNKDI